MHENDHASHSVEFALLKHLPAIFKVHQKEVNSSFLFQVQVDAAAIESPSMDKAIKSVQFDVVVDTQFPITQPKVHTLTNVMTILMLIYKNMLTIYASSDNNNDDK